MMPRIRKVEVFRRKGSPFWYVRYWEPTPSGGWKAQWKSSKSKRKADAEKMRRVIERGLDDGKRPDADVPWCEFAEDFLVPFAAPPWRNRFGMLDVEAVKAGHGRAGIAPASVQLVPNKLTTGYLSQRRQQIT